MESFSFEAVKKFVENLIVGARTVPATIIIIFTILFVGRDNLPTLIASQHYIVFLGILTTVIATLWRAELNGLPYRDWETDRKSTRLNSSHSAKSRMPSSA